MTATERQMMTAHDILKLLADKHSKDVFVAECKDGPTQCAVGMLRLDAWAMVKSWANPCTIAYEIKVSRNDFLRDSKWRGYLQYCNQLYFVCPPGVIQREELPAEIGLIETSKSGARLFTKRKAVWRDVQVPESLYRYILMCRTRVVDENVFSEREHWQKWLADRMFDRDLGHRVGRAIRETIRNEIERLADENRVLKRANDQLAEIREMLGALGYTGLPDTYHVHRHLDKLRETLPANDLYAAVCRMKTEMDGVADKLLAIMQGER